MPPRLSLLVLACVFGCLSSRVEASAVLFRAGDFNNTYTFGYEFPNGSYFRFYKDFRVPEGEQWTVQSIGGITCIGPRTVADLTMGRLEIRSGVSVGNGGTLLASGDRPVVATTFVTTAGNGPVYDYTVNLSQPLVLNAGLYWATLQPISTNFVNWFTCFTSGANSVGGPPIDGAAFASARTTTGTSDFYQWSSESAITVYGTRIPEPTVAAMIFPAALAAVRRRRG